MSERNSPGERMQRKAPQNGRAISEGEQLSTRGLPMALFRQMAEVQKLRKLVQTSEMKPSMGRKR